MRAGREELLFMSRVTATQESNAKEGREELQGSRFLLCQRFSACFLWEIALQRGEGEKREGMQISKKSTQNLLHHNNLALSTVANGTRAGQANRSPPGALGFGDCGQLSAGDGGGGEEGIVLGRPATLHRVTA